MTWHVSCVRTRHGLNGYEIWQAYYYALAKGISQNQLSDWTMNVNMDVITACLYYSNSGADLRTLMRSQVLQNIPTTSEINDVLVESAVPDLTTITQAFCNTLKSASRRKVRVSSTVPTTVQLLIAYNDGASGKDDVNAILAKVPVRHDS